VLGAGGGKEPALTQKVVKPRHLRALILLPHWNRGAAAFASVVSAGSVLSTGAGACFEQQQRLAQPSGEQPQDRPRQGNGLPESAWVVTAGSGTPTATIK
jgi:hypothetical protein